MLGVCFTLTKTTSPPSLTPNPLLCRLCVTLTSFGEQLKDAPRSERELVLEAGGLAVRLG